MFALLVAACSQGDPIAASDSGEARSNPTLSPLPGTADHIGAAACGQCHQEQLKDWQGSHHDLAMQEADADAVLGDFEQASFNYAGTTSTFSRREDRYFVTTDGPDGALAKFQIRYTFGHYPLQQYLIELPGGRLQALGIAWDSRAAPQGQRWFHLYPDQSITAGNPLHWTGRNQNWNFMCADCHSTALAKNYDADSDSYRTRWAEINVSCEACHGPGLAHAQWASQADPKQRATDPTRGLAVNYDERKNVSWHPVAETGNAVRSTPRTARTEIDSCGRCHGRANRLLGDAVHGRPLLDSHRPSLLDPDQYWPDGQMRGEVFNWGPFLQSKMQNAGVTCSDCHQPHSLQLRASGNTLCSQCHSPDKYDQVTHTRHASGSAGSQCVGCHMPTTTFMQVDDRHDHAFRIPRPDLSQTLGTPNACNACHDDKSAEWAADQLVRWFPDSKRRSHSFAHALHAANTGAAGAHEELSQLVADHGQPAIVRASAVRALAPLLRPGSAPMAIDALADSDPLVRMTAVETLAQLAPQQRVTLLAERLADPVLAVRMEAASALAGDAEQWLSTDQRDHFRIALGEYIASLEFNADRPDTAASLGDLQQRRGDAAAAEKAYRRALALDPDFALAYLHLADMERARGSEDNAVKILRDGLTHIPDGADLHHALGLSMVRKGNKAEAETLLKRATELAPDTPRYSYVFAVALHDWGKPEQARNWLTRTLQRHPTDRDVLNALALYELQAGNRETARGLIQRQLELEPDNAAARQLLQSIGP